jgi:hypothetical protein
MPDESRTGDSAQREREKREAEDRQTEEHADADREGKSDPGSEALRDGVPGSLVDRSS